MYRSPTYRRHLAYFGGGVGLGWSLKEVNHYLKDPRKERLPITLDNWYRSRDHIKTDFENVTNKVFPKSDKKTK